jgi:hypothetical protein
VWTSYDDLGGTVGIDFDIFLAISTDNGVTWDFPAPLNNNAGSDLGDDWVPQLTTDGFGTWVAVWDSVDDLEGTIGPDSDILVARSTDNGATWSDPVALNTNAATDTGDDFDPQLVTDGMGFWLAVWHSSDSLADSIGTDFDVLYATSDDGGLTWSAPLPLPDNAGADSSTDIFPQVATDGLGNWVAAWMTDNSDNGDWDIRAAISFFVPGLNPDNIFVDFTAAQNGVGTELFPFDNLQDAVDVANGGAAINISPGESTETFIGAGALGAGNQPMTLRRHGTDGVVRIGVP